MLVHTLSVEGTQLALSASRPELSQETTGPSLPLEAPNFTVSCKCCTGHTKTGRQMRGHTETVQGTQLSLSAVCRPELSPHH